VAVTTRGGGMTSRLRTRRRFTADDAFVVFAFVPAMACAVSCVRLVPLTQMEEVADVTEGQ
jgi:hypothetical protein